MAQSAIKGHLCHVLGSRDLQSGKLLRGSLGPRQRPSLEEGVENREKGVEDSTALSSLQQP